MSVSNYIPNNCKYRLDKLDKVVWLLEKELIGRITVDGIDEYVVSAATDQYNVRTFTTTNIEVEENETLDERYEYTHSIKFRINGYSNFQYIVGQRLIFRDMEGTYWLLNPEFKYRVTCTYTLSSEGEYTEFTLATKSNYPLLRVASFNPEYAKPCETYNFTDIDSLMLNETQYSRLTYDDYGQRIVKYTNDGFKTIKFRKNSLQFQEVYDGSKTSHRLSFNVNFDDYKSSWHNNLIEFTENKYAMVLSTKNGFFIASGFQHGLQPSYRVTANDNEVNTIEITLADLHDQGRLITVLDYLPTEQYSAVTWEWVSSEYECINTTTAKRLLKEERDAFGNGMGKYQCLDGYWDKYYAIYGNDLVGIFSEVETFPCDACAPSVCTLTTSIPNQFYFNNASCKSFSLKCDGEWSASTSSTAITVSPSSGASNTNYTVSVCNSEEPVYTVPQYCTITIDYCDNKTKTFTAITQIENVEDCLPQGDTYSVNQDAQWVTIPVACCVNSVTSNDDNINSIQIQNGYVRFWINYNDSGSVRYITLTFTKCDGTTVNAYVNQVSIFANWVKESEQCDGIKLCDVERMYSGTSSTAITAYTNFTRLTNCRDSSDCESLNSRWVETTTTQCSNGKLYYIEVYQIRIDGVWGDTGQSRLGRETEDISGQCNANIEHWVVDGGATTCNDTTLYEVERLYIEVNEGDPQADWKRTNITRRGIVMVYDSETCGYSGTTSTYQEWRTVSGYRCNAGNKYQNLRLYYSDDAVNWTATDIYKDGALIEANSVDCGHEDPYEYRWIITDVTQCGEL